MVELRENERKTLLALKEAGPITVEAIVRTSGLAHSAVMRAALTLQLKKFVRILEEKTSKASLTKEGKDYAEKGLPERRLVNALRQIGGQGSIDQILNLANLEKNLSVIALGWLNRKKWAVIEKKDQVLKLLKEPLEGADERLLSLLAEKATVAIEGLDKELRDTVSALKRRKLIDVREEIIRQLELTEDGRRLAKTGVEVTQEVSQLTPELIATGKWRQAKLLKYNIRAPVSHVWPGKKHPYLRFLDDLKQKLVALGFKEMTAPTVELSFFNCDALYMPQDHPARDIHDMYFIKEPRHGNLEEYQELSKNVRETHENGWKTGSRGWSYSFSMLEAARLMLRSQTTTASARTLVSDELEIPGKYFSVARCYRPDVIDKTHLTEFNQVEGIIVGEDLTLRDLLGVLERFAVDVAGADKVKYRPDYFPFTEPSVELVAYKEGYGWLEFGGSGIFRPEVTLPLGVDFPVLAWGLGVDRLFMMKAGIDDIRYLFTQDLDWLRHMELI